jgi:hypothetical protein
VPAPIREGILRHRIPHLGSGEHCQHMAAVFIKGCGVKRRGGKMQAEFVVSDNRLGIRHCAADRVGEAVC